MSRGTAPTCALGPPGRLCAVTDKTLPRPPQATLLRRRDPGRLGARWCCSPSTGSPRSARSRRRSRPQLFADSGLGKGLGLDADEWQSVLRVLCIVAGGAGRRHGVPRLAGAAARPLRAARPERARAGRCLVAGIAVADYIAGDRARSRVVLLWRRRSRDWFDGKVAPRPEPRPARRARRCDGRPGEGCRRLHRPGHRPHRPAAGDASARRRGPARYPPPGTAAAAARPAPSPPP